VSCLDRLPIAATRFDRFLLEQLLLAIALTGLFFEQGAGNFPAGTGRPIAPSPDLIVPAEMEILEPLAKKLICDLPYDS
jgi:hypothetical protein